MGAVKRMSASNARDLPPFLVHGNVADVWWQKSLLFKLAAARGSCKHSGRGDVAPNGVGFARGMGHNTPAMAAPLYNLPPPGDDFNSDDLLGPFLEYVTGKGLTYPAQEEAILGQFEDASISCSAP
jgi:hypothetical protein